MERMMSRERYSDEETGEMYHIIGGNDTHGGDSYIQVRVPEGSRPGSSDFPVCTDCGSADLRAEGEYPADDSPDWCTMMCEACGSVFIIEQA